MTCCGDKDDQFNPVKPRGCTDVLCLMLFLLFWGVLVFIAAFAFMVGSPLRLVYGTDSFGNICGMKNEPLGALTFSGTDMTDRPFVFYQNMRSISRSMKICVRKCPDEYLTTEAQRTEYEQKTGNYLCRYDFVPEMLSTTLYPPFKNASEMKAENEKGQGPCPKLPVYPSKPVLNRCVPETLTGLSKDIVYSIYGYLNNFDIFQKSVSDLYAGSKEMIIMVIVSIAMSFIMVMLLHFVAAIVSHVIMIVVVIGLIAVTGALWWTYYDIKKDLDQKPFDELLEESARNETAFLSYAIVSTIITVVLSFIILVLRKRVKLVVSLFKEAAKCIRSMPCLLLQPLWTFVLLLIFLVFWLAILLALATANYPTKSSLMQNETIFPNKEAITMINYNEASWVRSMWWFHILALIWICEFILACQQMVIAGSVASWYFSRDRKNLNCPIGKAITRLLFYHLGSIALGSFLIVLFRIPRLILLYIEAKLKQFPQSQLAQGCVKCCQCCLWCFEKFLRYLNHNAYTVIAIEGVGFCKGAEVAFTALVTNALRVATINSVGDFILFLGKCSVTAITALVGVIIMKFNEELQFYAVPLFFGCVVAFFIAHCVFSIYEMVIDTLFLCFCEDFNKNDGTLGKEYYAPPSLMQALDEKHLTGSESEEATGQPLQEIPKDPTPV